MGQSIDLFSVSVGIFSGQSFRVLHFISSHMLFLNPTVSESATEGDHRGVEIEEIEEITVSALVARALS